MPTKHPIEDAVNDTIDAIYVYGLEQGKKGLMDMPGDLLELAYEIASQSDVPYTDRVHEAGIPTAVAANEIVVENQRLEMTPAGQHLLESSNKLESMLSEYSLALYKEYLDMAAGATPDIPIKSIQLRNAYCYQDDALRDQELNEQTADYLQELHMVTGGKTPTVTEDEAFDLAHVEVDRLTHDDGSVSFRASYLPGESSADNPAKEPLLSVESPRASLEEGFMPEQGAAVRALRHAFYKGQGDEAPIFQKADLQARLQSALRDAFALPLSEVGQLRVDVITAEAYEVLGVDTRYEDAPVNAEVVTNPESDEFYSQSPGIR